MQKGFANMRDRNIPCNLVLPDGMSRVWAAPAFAVGAAALAWVVSLVHKRSRT